MWFSSCVVRALLKQINVKSQGIQCLAKFRNFFCYLYSEHWAFFY